MGKPHLYLVFAFPLLFAVIQGCASDECEGNKNSLPLAAFMSSALEPQSVSIDSLSIYGIGAPGDSILLDSAVNVSQTFLPFRIDEGSTTYVIQYLQKLLASQDMRDTLTFTYDIVPQFVSSACGAIYFYDNVRVSHTTHFIDSVSCPDGRITNANITNIFIYFRVDDTTAP